MLHTENRLINHQRRGQAQLTMQTMGNQEIRSRMDKSVLKHRRKLHRGGESIFSRPKLCESLESQQGVVVGRVHCKILRFASATAAPISNEIHFARGIRDSWMKAPRKILHAHAHLWDNTWPFNSSVLKEASVCARLRSFPMMVSLVILN